MGRKSYVGFPVQDKKEESVARREAGEISEEEILRTVRTYRKEKRAPEITVAAES